MFNRQISTLFSWQAIPWQGIGALLVTLLLAKWTWIFFAPTPLTTLPAKPESSSTTSALLFGVAVAPSSTSNNLPNVHLIGLFSGSKGFAILRLDGNRQLGVALGEEISKGNKLVEIGADFVTIENGGLRQRVMLENKLAANQKPVESQPLPTPPQATQAVTEWNQTHQEMQNTKNVIP